MKFAILFAVLTMVLTIAAISSKKETHATPAGIYEPVAVVELFTSQGCSSCPPADKLLAVTINDAKEKNKNIFALSFHVDYWNYIGWKDVFSNADYSQRQKKYVATLNLDGAYTPQMIVNGVSQFVGSDKGALSKSLDKALAEKAWVNFTQLSATYEKGKNVFVKYLLEGNYKDCKINFALLSLKETTAVNRGENKGRTLINENIVRQFITSDAAASGEIQFDFLPVPEQENMGIVAYVQKKDNLKIIGAAMPKMQTIH